MTSCRVKCLQTLSVELLVAASADPRMKRRCSYALGSFVRCPLCSADASLGCFQPLWTADDGADRAPRHPPSDISKSYITEQQYENGHGLL